MRVTCLDMVHTLARRDERVVFIGSDLSPGLLADMHREMPERYFMEGIAEANVIGMAAGLAMEGFVPYVNTIATFITRRCFEQIAVDLCLHNLPVRLIGNGAGLVYTPLGPTHLAVEDMAIMRALPNMTVVAVSDADEMRRFMEASLDWPGPIYIRLAKGGDPVVSRAQDGFAIGRAVTLRRASADGAVAFLATGVMTANCLAAADILAGRGIDCSVVHFATVKPLDVQAVLDHARRARLVVAVEEGVRSGGLGSAVVESVVEGLDRERPSMLRLGLPDAFSAKYGTQADHFAIHGLTPEGIAATVMAATARAGLAA